MELFVLETERLRLHPLTLDDAEKLHQLFDTEPDVWKFEPGYKRSFDEGIKLIEREGTSCWHKFFRCTSVDATRCRRRKPFFFHR